MINIFVSHSSSDDTLAEALVHLLDRSLGMAPESIRCTSVDGYRLPAGVATDEQLKLEVRNSKAFIGLITPTSIESSYVLFELGARWGAGLHLIPLLARGATLKELRGPLSSLNALSCSSKSQIFQLLQDLSRFLQVTLRPMASWSKNVDLLSIENNIKGEDSLSGIEISPAPSVSHPGVSNSAMAASMEQRKDWFENRVWALLGERYDIYQHEESGIAWSDDPEQQSVMVWSVGGDEVDAEGRKAIRAIGQDLGFKVGLRIR